MSNIKEILQMQLKDLIELKHTSKGRFTDNQIEHLEDEIRILEKRIELYK